MAQREEQFAARLRDAMTGFAKATEEMRRMQEIFNSRNYGDTTTGITAEDAAVAGLTTDEVLGILYLFDDTYAFLNNGTPPQQDRKPFINRVRSDY